jgi:hypothetical protein
MRIYRKRIPSISISIPNLSKLERKILTPKRLMFRIWKAKLRKSLIRIWLMFRKIKMFSAINALVRLNWGAVGIGRNQRLQKLRN